MKTILTRTRVNQSIRADKIRLIGENGEQLGVTSSTEALELARAAGLDLVEVAGSAKPPVCRIMDYSRHKYEQEKKEKVAKKHQKRARFKEIKLRPKIEEHDYQVKFKHVERFLLRGDKVKVTLMFRGREMAHQELGRRIMDRLVKDLVGAGQVEKGPTTEGRFINTVFAPK